MKELLTWCSACLSHSRSSSASAAVGAEETPLGEWSVVRLRSAGKGTVHTIGSVAGAFAPRQAGSRGSDVAVLRQLVLTRSALVERRPDNYEVRSCASCQDRSRRLHS